jgi:predicted nucleic acid-binding protein
MTAYVFDAEPLVAYLYNEPGSDVVDTIFDEIHTGEATGWLCEVNATEVMYIVAQLEAKHKPVTDDHLNTGREDVQILDSADVFDVVGVPWPLVAEIKGRGGISLGDAHAVALASDRDGTLVVGSDSEFNDLPVDIDLARIREEGVDGRRA